MRFESYDALLP